MITPGNKIISQAWIHAVNFTDRLLRELTRPSWSEIGIFLSPGRVRDFQRDPKPISYTWDRVESTEFFESLKCQEKYTKKFFSEIGRLTWFRGG